MKRQQLDDGLGVRSRWSFLLGLSVGISSIGVSLNDVLLKLSRTETVGSPETSTRFVHTVQSVQACGSVLDNTFLAGQQLLPSTRGFGQRVLCAV